MTKWILRFTSVGSFSYMVGVLIADQGEQMPASTLDAAIVWTWVLLFGSIWLLGYGSRAE